MIGSDDDLHRRVMLSPLPPRTLKELTALLEQISGSDELKREYDELEEQKARAEEKSALIYHEKRTIVMDRKQKKGQKVEVENYIRLQQDLVHHCSHKSAVACIS